MIVHCYAHVIPPDTDGWSSRGFDLPMFTLDSDTLRFFADLDGAIMIAADVSLYGRTPGTSANITVVEYDGTVSRLGKVYVVTAEGRLTSVGPAVSPARSK